MRRFYDELAQLLAVHPALVVATLVKVAGSSPRDEGAKMVVLADGGLVGTLGGGSLEAHVAADALACLARRTPELKEYALSEDALQMKCGGKVEVYLEPLFPPERLVLFGGGHVGKAIARLAPRLGFSVTVVDDREEHLRPGEYPAGVQTVRCDAHFRTGFVAPTAEDFVVVVTRQADLDADLAGLYAGRCTYVGVMGSLKKREFIRRRLMDAGLSQERFDAIRCPMGLDIGSDTPDEIAVSVLAEMVSVRAKRRSHHGDTEARRNANRGREEGIKSEKGGVAP